MLQQKDIIKLNSAYLLIFSCIGSGLIILSAWLRNAHVDSSGYFIFIGLIVQLLASLILKYKYRHWGYG